MWVILIVEVEAIRQSAFALKDSILISGEQTVDQAAATRTERTQVRAATFKRTDQFSFAERRFPSLTAREAIEFGGFQLAGMAGVMPFEKRDQ